jgi:hypothetical protein
MSARRGRHALPIRQGAAIIEIRQTRFRPETLALVARANANADEKRATGVDLDEEMASFLHRLDELTASTPPDHVACRPRLFATASSFSTHLAP